LFILPRLMQWLDVPAPSSRTTSRKEAHAR